MIKFLPAIAFSALPTFQEFLEQSPALAARLRQRLSEVRIAPDAQNFFCEYPDFLNLVALIDETSPDLSILLPMWARIAALCPRMDLRVASITDEMLIGDEGADASVRAHGAALARLLEQPDLPAFLEEMGLPLLCILDEEWHFQVHWGPHPQAAESYLETWFMEHPEYDQLAESETPEEQAAYDRLNDALYDQMRIWYQAKLTAASIEELKAVFAALREESAEDEGSDLLENK